MASYPANRENVQQALDRAKAAIQSATPNRTISDDDVASALGDESKVTTLGDMKKKKSQKFEQRSFHWLATALRKFANAKDGMDYMWVLVDSHRQDFLNASWEQFAECPPDARTIRAPEIEDAPRAPVMVASVPGEALTTASAGIAGDTAKRASWKSLLYAAIGLIAGALGSYGLLQVQTPNRDTVPVPPPIDDPCAVLYDDAFKSGPVQIVLSNPPVYKYVNDGERPALGRLDPARSLTNVTAGQELIRSVAQYTGMGEARTAYDVGIYFATQGVPTTLAQSREVANLKGPMILLGGWLSNPGSENFISESESKLYADFDRSLRFQVGSGFIIDRSSAGRRLTPSFAIAKQLPGELVPLTEYALLLKVRDPFTGNNVVIVAGVNSQGTEAAGRLIASRCDLLRSWLLDAFDQKIPEHFQLLIQVGVRPDNARPGESLVLLAAEPWSPRASSQ